LHHSPQVLSTPKAGWHFHAGVTHYGAGQFLLFKLVDSNGFSDGLEASFLINTAVLTRCGSWLSESSTVSNGFPRRQQAVETAGAWRLPAGHRAESHGVNERHLEMCKATV
jgi:hypothetical protein